MGLSHAAATVPLFPTGELTVRWKMVSQKTHVDVYAPPKTRGVFRLGDMRMTLKGKSEYYFSAKLSSYYLI